VAVNLTVVTQALVEGKALQLFGIELTGFALKEGRGAFMIGQMMALIQEHQEDTTPTTYHIHTLTLQDTPMYACGLGPNKWCKCYAYSHGLLA